MGGRGGSATIISFFFPLWKIEQCITTVEAEVITAMNHSSSPETASRLKGISNKTYKTKVENNHSE